MYCLGELLTAVCLVVVLSAILFAASAAAVVIAAGARRLRGRSARYVGQSASVSGALPGGWKAVVSGPAASLAPQAGKL